MSEFEQNNDNFPQLRLIFDHLFGGEHLYNQSDNGAGVYSFHEKVWLNQKQLEERRRNIIESNNQFLNYCNTDGIVDGHLNLLKSVIQFLSNVDLNWDERKSQPLKPIESATLDGLIYNITTPEKSISRTNAVKATHYLLNPTQEFPFSTEEVQAMRSQIITNANEGGVDVAKYVKYAMISALKEFQKGSLQHMSGSNPDLRYTFGVRLFGCLLFVRKSDLKAAARAMEYDLEQLIKVLSRGLSQP